MLAVAVINIVTGLYFAGTPYHPPWKSGANVHDKKDWLEAIQEQDWSKFL